MWQTATNVVYRWWSNKVLSELGGNEAYLLRGQKYFAHEWNRFFADFKKLHWITYCQQFKPLLMEMGKYQGQQVKQLGNDNGWGCTVRCLQMLVANAINQSTMSRKLFDNNVRGSEAPFSIQNVAEVGLKHFAVYPG